jgi:hypothetical protein
MLNLDTHDLLFALDRLLMRDPWGVSAIVLSGAAAFWRKSRFSVSVPLLHSRGSE